MPQNGVPVPAQKKYGAAAIALGIIGIVFSFLFAIVGHICSIIAIGLGINDVIKKRKPAGLILGVVGEVLSIVSSIIGAVTAASYFL